MHKLLAFLVLAGVALAVPTATRRCANYNHYNDWKGNYLVDKEWVVAASTASGSVFGWRNDYEFCDAYFTYGVPQCGSCTFIRFIPNSRYSGDFGGYTMVQYAWNSNRQDYDYTENFIGRAYNGYNAPVYRCYTREPFDRTYFGYKDVMDPDFVPYDAWSNDLTYSAGVLSYCPKNNIVILVICNNFQYMNYVDNYPIVVVLAQDYKLNADQKNYIVSELEKNNINPYGVILRDNYNCKARTLYNPSIYL
uniref:SP31.6 n=1 Tax=Bemisia tabaci TaxID=7038 RepID=A0A7S5HG37_BEMTA|nr:SP31.6 [Bemisia tabaci]